MKHGILVALITFLFGCKSIYDQNAVLLHAARIGDTQAVGQMLDKHADLISTVDHDSGDTPLHLAVKNGHAGLATVLVSRGASVNMKNKNGDTALQLTVTNNHVGLAELLLSKNANVNDMDRHGDTPLHLALRNNHADIATLLLAKGANVNDMDRHGDTPLRLAAKNNHAAIVELLMARGADINKKNKYGDTPLHLALKSDRAEIAELLMARGANINERGALDDTPLHVSMYKGQTNMVAALRLKGADETSLNQFGLTPEEMKQLPMIQRHIDKAAQLLTPNGKWTDQDEARVLYDVLKTRRSKHLVNALVLQILRGSDRRLQALILAMKLGAADSQDQLVRILMVFGSKSMAEDYLNSGSGTLADGARRWANAHGYHVTTGRQGSRRAFWGSF